MAEIQNGKLILDKAAFTVSIDFELMWGTIDRPCHEKFRKICTIEREQVIDRLLELLTEFEIPATWGIVGHLFLADPNTNQEAPSLLHGADLVEKIRRCPIPQDIGSHTFSHVMMGDPCCTREVAERELSECVRLAKEAGLDLKSLIFPRNRVGYLDAARRHGFNAYRGPEPHWYAKKRRLIRRMAHLFDILTARTPPSVLPTYEPEGIWNIPGSMLYTPSFGMRRFVPVSWRVVRARTGLAEAVRRRRVFHLWFHPTDLVCRMDDMMDGLRAIFQEAIRWRDAGRLDFRSMQDLVPVQSEQRRAPRRAFSIVGAKELAR